MSRLAGSGIALPKVSLSAAELAAAGTQWLGAGSADEILFHRLVASSRVAERRFALPVEEVLSLRGLEHRTGLFDEVAPALGEQALRNGCAAAGISPGEIQTLVFTSCSAPSIPAVDGLIIDRAGLPRTVRRLPVFQHGCAGGVVGLGLAAEFARQGGVTALVCVELCSLLFPGPKPAPQELVGSAIFGDGAACAVLTPDETGLVVVAHESFLIPDSRHLMGYDIRDDGFHLRLDRALPQLLMKTVPDRVTGFLHHHGLTRSAIAHWLFHPGGIKILDYLEETFAPGGGAPWSRQVLQEIGNLSSATILVILDRFMKSGAAQPGEYIMMTGIGPGLTLEIVLLQQR